MKNIGIFLDLADGGLIKMFQAVQNQQGRLMGFLHFSEKKEFDSFFKSNQDLKPYGRSIRGYGRYNSKGELI